MSDTSIILDCETLDTEPTAVITEIGLIAVNRADFCAFDELTIVPDLYYQLAAGRTVSADTIEFRRKNRTLPDHVIGLTPIATIVAIQDFIDRHSPKSVWIQGTCFDRPLIEDFCRRELQPLPWHFTISRDARTLWNLAFPGQKHDSRPHRAIPDCKATLKDIHASLKAIGKLDSF